MSRAIVFSVLAGALAVFHPGPAGAKVTLMRSGCFVEVTWFLQLHGADDPLRSRILQAAQECYGGKDIGECCRLLATVNIVMGGAPQEGYDQIQVRSGADVRPRSKLGELNGADGVAEWPLSLSKEAIGAHLGYMAGIKPEVRQERQTKMISPYDACVHVPRIDYPPCREGSKFYKAGGRIYKFHLERLLEASGETCPESCCPEDQGRAGGSGGPDYSEDEDDAPGVRFAAAGPISRPSAGPVNILAVMGEHDFFFDYTHPASVGGGLGFGEAVGSFTLQVDPTPDPLLNPVLDPEEAAFMVTSFQLTGDPFEVEPGLSSGINTLTLTDMELVELGLVSPSFGFLVDKQAAASPAVRGAASTDPDGWFEGYMSVKWVNDVWTDSNPAYFDVPISGQLDYTTGTGFFGMFGGLVYMLETTGLPGPARPADRTLLSRAYPNPFGAATTIRFLVEEASPVTLRIADVGGRVVRTVVDAADAPPGTYYKIWDGLDDRGRRASPGVYFAVLTVGERHASTRMVLAP
jgi:hypothetical protein